VVFALLHIGFENLGSGIGRESAAFIFNLNFNIISDGSSADLNFAANARVL
jgi:hypothetical protein